MSPSARAVLAVLAAAALAAPARAASSGDDVFRFFREEADAVTALRRPAPVDRSPLAVDVITRREIEDSGARDVWDLLRFRVGLDVIEGRDQQGADRAVVSVRGIPRDSVNELQVLVDGRSVYSPVSGGVLWEHIPVQLQDIERIEIVRGPNAALYGSNAGLGVINIITRRPEAPFRAEASVSGGSLDARDGSAAVEAARAGWGARLSASDRAPGGFPKADGSGTGNDWLRDQKANFRGWANAGPDATVEALAGVARGGLGQTTGTDTQGTFLDHFQTLRATRRFDGGSTLEARVSRTEDDTRESPDINGNVDVADTRYWQYDAEALNSIPWADGRLRTTYGLAWRYAASRSNSIYGLGTGDVTNRTLRGYLHQEIRLTDAVSVLGGASNETANAGGDHTDYQAAALWSPIPGQSLRLSYAHADTMPQLFNRYGNLASYGGAVHVYGSTDLAPSPLTDYEAGWLGRFFDDRVDVEVTGYYMDIRSHLNLDGSSTVLTYDNTNLVELRGLETSLKWRPSPGRFFYANFTRETVTDDDGHKLYIHTTPNDKANFGADADLPWRLRASFNAGYKDVYLADSNTGQNQDLIPAFWRLDARLAWTARPGVELFVAGQNLLAPSRREYIDGLAVPRVIFGGVNLRWR
ncbi:MAG: TonB-dependent receptor [Elusimicrobia bacterium]|nr:TonB-dependent receptor [Elusimicrobiota bacterium]